MFLLRICVCVFSEHSMAETLSVALRVAEEAIDEAISKAEVNGSAQVASLFTARKGHVLVF